MNEAPATTTGLLRARRGRGHHRVTTVELFFDLVFVFAITQLSHSLLADMSPAGALRHVMLLMAVWWAWMYTSWATNWLDPDRTPVRLLLYGLMLAGLVLSSSIPKAFGDRALAFAGAYAVMQIGRTLFVLRALRGHSPDNHRNFQRILVWFVFSCALWIAGGLADGSLRFGLWIAALTLDYVAPAVAFWTPWQGRSSTTDWDVEGGHMAERCALFIIIALGESILVTGATLSSLPEWKAPYLAAFAIAFLGSVAMWWIYFDTGAETASRRISDSSDPGRVARIAYTYVHLPIVAGIVVSAAGDEIILAHPTGHADMKAAATAIGGPAIYLLGNILFKRITANRWPLSHLVGLACLAGIATIALSLEPLALGGAVAAVLVGVAIWETVSLRHTRARLMAGER